MAERSPNQFDIRRIPAHLTHTLRHQVLRPHQQRADVRFSEDDAASTIHLGVFDPELFSKWGEPIAVATFTTQPMPGQSLIGDWQLRGMAVDPAYQGYGVGKKIIQAGLDIVRSEQGQRLWCNARISAKGFYLKMGFDIHGLPFEIPDIGPHCLMAIAVNADSR